MAVDPRSTRRPFVIVAAATAPYLVAILAHGAMIFGASRLPPVRWLLGDGHDDARNAVEIDIEPLAADPLPAPVIAPPKVDPPREMPDVEEHPQAATVAPRAANVATHAPAIAAATTTNGTGAPVAGAGDGSPSASTAEPAPPSTSEPPDEYGGTAAGPAPGSGIGVVGEFALQSSGAAPTKAPSALLVPADAANLALNKTLRTRDKKAGVSVPAAGVVVGTVSTTMRAMSLPHNAHATFEVTLGPGGKVTGTKVVSASAGDASQWDAAAKSVQSALASQALTLDPDLAKTGVTVRVSVTQKHVYPTGTAKGIDVKPVCANGILNELADAADDKPSKPVDPSVPLFQDENGRPCIPVGVSATADASNIGTEKHIEVRSTFEVIVPGQADLPEEIHEINSDAPWVERGKAGPRPTLPQKARKYIRDKEKKK